MRHALFCLSKQGQGRTHITPSDPFNSSDDEQSVSFPPKIMSKEHHSTQKPFHSLFHRKFIGFTLVLIILVDSANGFTRFLGVQKHIRPANRFENNYYQFENRNFLAHRRGRTNPCSNSKRLLIQMNRLLIEESEEENLSKFKYYWAKRVRDCEARLNQRRRANFIQQRILEQPRAVPESPNSGIRTFLGLTGLGGLLLSPFLLLLPFIKIGSPLQQETPQRKLVTQIFHINSPGGSSEESGEKKKESHEESDKKKAAVGVGLAREILSINAESIHLTAHIIEFLLIMTQLARALSRTNMLPGLSIPPPGQFLTQSQALQLLQTIQNNEAAKKALRDICSGLNNPSKYIFGSKKNSEGNDFCKEVLNSAKKNLALQKLFNLISPKQKLPGIT